MDKRSYYSYIKAKKGSPFVFKLDDQSFEKLFQQFRVETKRIFPELEYFLISGHFAYGKANINSDIDIGVILNKSIYSQTKDVLDNRREKFSQLYKRVHRRYGIAINPQYPGEIATLPMIDDVIFGRGFDVKNNRLNLKLIKNEAAWLDEEELDFRGWLGIMAFNNNKLIYGDFNKFITLRHKVFLTLMKFLLLQFKNKDHSLVDFKIQIHNLITNRGYPYLGVDSSFNPELFLDTSLLIDISIDTLVKDGFIELKGNKLQIKMDDLINWENNLIKQIDNKKYESITLYPWKRYAQN